MHELFDGDIVTDTNNPSVGRNFGPMMSPLGNRIALLWTRIGSGLWIIEKGDTPSEPNLITRTPPAHTVYQSVNTKLLHGKRIRFAGVARFQPAENVLGQNAEVDSFVGLRVLPELTSRNRVGAFAQFEVRVNQIKPIHNDVWKSFELEAVMPSSGGDLVVFCGLAGEGTVWCDDLEVMVKGVNGWKPVELKNGGFEHGMESGLPMAWSQTRPLNNHEVNIVPSRDERKGNVLKIQSKPVTHRSNPWFPLRWASSGDSLYVRDPEKAIWEYSLADAKLEKIVSMTEYGNIGEVDISADGKRLVYSLVENNSDVWLVENYDRHQSSAIHLPPTETDP